MSSVLSFTTKLKVPSILYNIFGRPAHEVSKSKQCCNRLMSNLIAYNFMYMILSYFFTARDTSDKGAIYFLSFI